MPGGRVCFWEMWGVNGIMNVDDRFDNEVDVVKEQDVGIRVWEQGIGLGFGKWEWGLGSEC